MFKQKNSSEEAAEKESAARPETTPGEVEASVKKGSHVQTACRRREREEN